MNEEHYYTYFCIIKESPYKNLNLLEKILFRIGGGNTKDELYGITFSKREAIEFVNTIGNKNYYRIESRTIKRDSDDGIRIHKELIMDSPKFLRRYSYENYGYIYLREMDVDELKRKGVCIY